MVVTPSPQPAQVLPLASIENWSVLLLEGGILYTRVAGSQDGPFFVFAARAKDDTTEFLAYRGGADAPGALGELSEQLASRPRTTAALKAFALGQTLTATGSWDALTFGDGYLIAADPAMGQAGPRLYDALVLLEAGDLRREPGPRRQASLEGRGGGRYPRLPDPAVDGQRSHLGSGGRQRHRERRQLSQGAGGQQRLEQSLRNGGGLLRRRPVALLGPAPAFPVAPGFPAGDGPLGEGNLLAGRFGDDQRLHAAEHRRLLHPVPMRGRRPGGRPLVGQRQLHHGDAHRPRHRLLADGQRRSVQQRNQNLPLHLRGGPPPPGGVWGSRDCGSAGLALGFVLIALGLAWRRQNAA